MIQWGNTVPEARLAILDMVVKCLLLGVYCWEYFWSLDVEYAVIRRRITFRYPLIPYLLGRLSLLIALILLVILQTQVPASFACQPAIIAAAVFGNTTVACSSANFMIRTWVIWKDSRLVHIVLLLVVLGHWTTLALGVTNVKAFGSNGVCVVYMVQPILSAAVFVSTMFYDILVFILFIVKLSKQPSQSPLMGYLRSQGLLYFAVAVTANIIPTVFVFIGSTSMMAITGCFAMTASTVVSCRAVRSLLGLRTPQSNHTLDENVERNVALTTDISIT